MTRYRVRHKTSYEYGSEVDLASHYLHLRPRSMAHQRVVSSELVADPEPTRMAQGEDYFGNCAGWMFLDLAHDAFEVSAISEVEVCFPTPPEAGSTPPWEVVRDQAIGAFGAAGADFLFDSPMLVQDEAVRRYVERSFPAGRPILEGLLELTTRIYREFKFKAHVTGLNTPVGEVLSKRSGVCQDFANLMITGLRGLGLPARYVSGYIRTHPAPGEVKRLGSDVSHAWVGCWMGVEHGWVDLDPTNDLVVREEHVVLGWGRDYSDVSPVRGMILGGGEQILKVEVDLEAL